MAILHDEHALIHALHKRGDEAELTQAIASVLRTDPATAAAFCRIAVSNAPRGGAEIARRLPERMFCTAEETVAAGRVDLVFRDDVAKWKIFVELKIHAGYGKEQLRRYVDSLGYSSANTALVAITRDVPTAGEQRVLDDPRWLGSVRWGEIRPYLRGLRPANESLASQWLLFLDVLEQSGSMGFLSADPELFRAWGREAEARRHTEDFVDAVRTPILQRLRQTLVAKGLAEREDQAADFDLRGKMKKRAVFPRRGKMQAYYRVPSQGSIAVKVGLWGWGDVNFAVEVDHPAARSDSSEAVAMAASLGAAGFRSWRDRLMERFLPMDSDRLRSPDLQEIVIEFAAETFGILADVGYFALPGGMLIEPEADSVGEGI